MTPKEIIDSAYNQINNQLSSPKCKKGHSYRVDLKRTERINYNTFRRKWTCINCGRFMETK